MTIYKYLKVVGLSKGGETVGRILTAILVSIGVVIIFIGLTLVMMETSEPWKIPKWYDAAWYILIIGLLIPVPAAMILNLRDWLKARKPASEKPI